MFFFSLHKHLRVMVFNVIFNNISVITWQSVLLVEETKVPEENHWPVTSHRQTISHYVLSSTQVTSPGARFKLTVLVMIGTDCTCSCKSNYHTTTTAPHKLVVSEQLFNSKWAIFQEYRRENRLKAYRLSELNFLFMLNVANIWCFILIAVEIFHNIIRK